MIWYVTGQRVAVTDRTSFDPYVHGLFFFVDVGGGVGLGREWNFRYKFYLFSTGEMQ